MKATTTVPSPTVSASLTAPAAMLLAMVPGVYEELDGGGAVHALYHAGVGALALVTGVAAAGLGRAVGRIVLVLSVGMALMYAGGVTGG